jgi:transposase
MFEVAGEEVQAQAMDHHGLVAAVCKDLKIAERINKRLNVDPQRKVSPGQAVVAMILNGLGFTNRRLYLSHQFFASKPVEQLLGEGICATDITNHTLSHTLDEIAHYGSTTLYGDVAFETVLENNLLSELNHLDTTSLTVHGQYEVDDEAEIVELTQGYSKDHRPDLKQAVLSLVVNGPASIPLWMEPLDGNSSDKTSFHETIKHVLDFKQQIKLAQDFRWVADSALYSKEHLLKTSDYRWVCRVPETVKPAKELVGRPAIEFTWQTHDKGYKTASFSSTYGGQPQRWLLVFSEQAYAREKKTLDKKLAKQEQALTKALWHLGNEVFNCQEDAKKAIDRLKKQYPLHIITHHCEAIERYAKRGKPKAEDAKQIKGYQVKAHHEPYTAAIEPLLLSKGRFILATNELNYDTYPDEQLLSDYKDQQGVERGFRFLKDPWFMVDSIFLKLPRRIEALMMVMTLCLMVYNIAQYRLRQTLKEKEETLPNQLGKPVQNPTVRWLFQCMEGISIVYLQSDKTTKALITGLTPLRKKIIRLFGPTACRLYGLIAENTAGGL